MSLQPDQNNYSITGLIIAGFILILLLTMVNFAWLSCGEQFDFDPDDFDFLELGTINAILALFFFATLVLGFELGVFATTLRLEYLKSHIGEKRPASAILHLNNSSFRIPFPWTALFLMPSFCSFSSEVSSLSQVGQILVLGRSIQFRSKKSFAFIQEVCSYA